MCFEITIVKNSKYNYAREWLVSLFFPSDLPSLVEKRNESIVRAPKRILKECEEKKKMKMGREW